MKDFRRPSGQGAGRHDGHFEKREPSSDFRSARPSFENRGGGGYNKYSSNRDSGERREVKHKATCSDCNNVCEVPFRPNGSKPVYCKDCFGKKKGAYPSNNEKKEFSPRAETVRQEHSNAEPRDARIDELKAQVFSMQSKLDRVIKMLEGGSPSVSVATPVAKVAAVVSTPVKKEEKKEKKVSAPAVKKAVPAPAVKKPAAKKVVAKAKPVAKKKK
jgi:CxxC-x17-CxxC domain-containing protein